MTVLYQVQVELAIGNDLFPVGAGFRRTSVPEGDDTTGIEVTEHYAEAAKDRIAEALQGE